MEPSEEPELRSSMLVANALNLLCKRIGKLDTPIESDLKSAKTLKKTGYLTDIQRLFTHRFWRAAINFYPLRK